MKKLTNISKAPKPSEIKENDISFGKSEVEDSAKKLISFFIEQKNDEWRTFTLKELINFYTRKNWNVDEILLGLDCCWVDVDSFFSDSIYGSKKYLLRDISGSYIVTTELIKHLAPKKV